MKRLVAESLHQYTNPKKLNEQAEDAITFVSGAIGVLLAAGGLAYLQNKLESSDNKYAKKLGDILGKLGKGAAEGTKKTPTGLGESKKINEAVDPSVAELATYIAGALTTIAASGGLAILLKKMEQSKDPRAQKFAKALAKLGKGAAAGEKNFAKD